MFFRAPRGQGIGLGPYILIGLGGLLGANARYVVSVWAANRYGTSFPYGTFVVNVTGSFLMAFFLTVAGDHLGSSPSAEFFVATGFLGAYTTFSTFTYETIALLRVAELRPGLTNALGSAVVGVAGAAAGLLLATAWPV